MNEVWVGLVTLAGGYYAHVLQDRYTRKHQRRDEDIALIKDLRRRLIELRDQKYELREQELRGVGNAADALAQEVVYLRHAKLRGRVTEDLKMASDFLSLRRGEGSPVDTQKIWIQDAIDALAAVARGGRLPEHSDEYNTRLFIRDREYKKLGAHLKPVIAGLAAMLDSPETKALLKERSEWEAERRAKRGWRRFIPRRKPRSEVAAG